MAAPRTIEITDSAMLRALAHPLRARLLAALRVDGAATATQLAKRFSESSGLTSYHLRQLEKAGFVREDAGRGTGRERWWIAAHDVTHWQLSSFRADEADREASTWLLRRQIETIGRWLSAYADAVATEPVRWLDAAEVSDYSLRLTPEQAGALREELWEVVHRHEQAAADAQPGSDAERLVLVLGLFPLREAPL